MKKIDEMTNEEMISYYEFARSFVNNGGLLNSEEWATVIAIMEKLNIKL